MSLRFPLRKWLVGLSATAAAAAGAVTVVEVVTGAGAAAAAVSQSCSPASAVHTDGASSRPGTQQVLVPSGADYLLVCRYGTQRIFRNGTSGTLDSAGATHSIAEIAKITRELDAIPPNLHVPCPMYLMIGGETAKFDYRTGPSVTLTVQLGGCSDLSNGHITRIGITSPALEAIQSLLRPVSTGTASPSSPSVT